MKKIFMTFGMTSLFVLSLHADVQADGASFCSDKDFENPMSYIAIRDANVYRDALVDGYIEQAKIKGQKIKQGTSVKVYAIGKNCNDPKTVFMNTDNVGFTGVKLNDFKKVK